MHFNHVIRNHNQISNDFDRQINLAAKHIVDSMVAQGIDMYSRLVKAKEDAISKKESLKDEIQATKREITQLESQIREHLDPDELNEDLKRYLGHSDFRLRVSDGGYKIMRGTTPAESLSEGEKTALALLYFLKSLCDDRFNLGKGVVVLDDPISSLDSNALHLAFGYIKEYTADAAQLLVFTHNFAFFGLVKNWFHHVKGQKSSKIHKRPARFYMLNRTFSATTSETIIQKLDPLLEEYESEYEYLFKRVFEAAKREPHIPLEEAYVLSNVSRRLLEAFLSFRYPDNSGGLYNKMEKVKFHKATKVCILRFVNVFSHYHAINAPTHSPSVYGESKTVLRDILKLMETEDPRHFLAMEQLAKTHRSGEVENY